MYDDSGYLTSPGGVTPVHRDKPRVVVATDKVSDDLHGGVEVDRKSTRKTSVYERLEQNTAKDHTPIVANAGVDIVEDVKGTVGASPRIAEGLTKKLDGSKDIKQAVKSQKRKPSQSDHGTPLKAIPSDPDIKDKSAPLKAFRSDPDIQDGRNAEDTDEHKTKPSKIPVYIGKAEDPKPHRKTSWTDSSSEGSKSRRSSLGDGKDSRSRRSSGNEEVKSRKSSASDQDGEAPTPHSKVVSHIRNQENLKKLLNDATAQVRASLEKNKAKVKSNTFGAEGSTNPLTSARDQAPQSRTWPQERTEDLISHDLKTVQRSAEDTSHVPKPPDVMGSPRRSSLTRKLSGRGHHRSGSDSSREDIRSEGSEHSRRDSRSESKSKRHHSGTSSSSRKSSVSDVDCVVIDPSSSPENTGKQQFVRHSRGRASVREPKKVKEVVSEKRASSVGPVVHGGGSPSRGVVTVKPPLARPPHTRLPDTPPTTRRRTQSEQGTSSSGEMEPGQSQAHTSQPQPTNEKEPRQSQADTSQSQPTNEKPETPTKASPTDKKRPPPIKISHRR